MKRCAPFLLSLILGLTVVAQAAGPEVLRTFKIGGEGRWDYVALDPVGGRLFVPRSTRVMVLDLDGHLKGEVLGTAGVHGVAFSAELDRGWTSNGQSNTVTVFKLSTLEVQKVVKTTGENPDAILFEPATKRVFTFNGRGMNATVIDALSGEVVGSIPMGGKPEFAACDSSGRVYVNNEDTSEILAIEARTLKVKARWSIKPVEEPSGLAMDVRQNRLFSVGRNRLAVVVDAGSGKVLAVLPIGSGTDGIAFDPGTGCAYASNGSVSAGSALMLYFPFMSVRVPRTVLFTWTETPGRGIFESSDTTPLISFWPETDCRNIAENMRMVSISFISGRFFHQIRICNLAVSIWYCLLIFSFKSMSSGRTLILPQQTFLIKTLTIN